MSGKPSPRRTDYPIIPARGAPTAPGGLRTRADLPPIPADVTDAEEVFDADEVVPLDEAIEVLEAEVLPEEAFAAPPAVEVAPTTDVFSLDADDYRPVRGPAAGDTALAPALPPPAPRTVVKPATAHRPAVKITFVCPGEASPLEKAHG